MRTRVALVLAAAALIVLGVWSPAEAQTTTTSSSTTTTTIDPAVVASRAAAAILLPEPRILMNPDASRDQLVNLAAWLWVEPRGPQRSSYTEGPTTLQVTASILSVRFDTGDGETLTCPGGGTPYDAARPEADQSSDCTHAWRHSSAASGSYRVTATVTWGLGWSGGPLGTRQSSGSIDVQVAEGQSLDRPPTPLPGQTVLGGPGATDAPGTGDIRGEGGPGASPREGHRRSPRSRAFGSSSPGA